MNHFWFKKRRSLKGKNLYKTYFRANQTTTYHNQAADTEVAEKDQSDNRYADHPIDKNDHAHNNEEVAVNDYPDNGCADLFIDENDPAHCSDNDSDDENDSDFVPSASSSISSSSDFDESSSETKELLSPKEKRQKYLQQQMVSMGERILVSDAKQKMFQQLLYAGFDEYFNGGLLVDLSESMQGTLKYRVLDFLYFLYLSDTTVTDKNINVVEMITSFIINDMGKFAEYCKQLSEIQSLTPYTVRNYVDHLLKFLEWFVLYRKQTVSSKKSKISAGSFINSLFSLPTLLIFPFSALGTHSENGKKNS